MPSKRKDMTFLRDYPEVPVKWTEGTAADRKPVMDVYFAGWEEAVRAASAAAVLGLNFRLDFYVAPISDREEQEECHLTVFKRVVADSCITGKATIGRNKPDAEP